MAVNKKIADDDKMFDRPLEGYLANGNEAFEATKRALRGRVPSKILDLPSGHGRVARHLRAGFPDAELYVADLDEPGADFCAREFDAIKLQSTPHFDDIDFGIAFDLIWVGSLITHLDQEPTRAFLRFLRRHLTRFGVAVVSSHGPLVAGYLRNKEVPVYGLTLEDERRVLHDYFTYGYGYANYPFDDAYGISLISKRWLSESAAGAGLSMDRYEDHSWDYHHDLAFFTRA